MPLTYHFKPFPKPGESHFSIENTSPRSQPSTATSSCTCRKDTSRCKQCLHYESAPKTSSAKKYQQPPASLSPIDEHTDPIHRQLTPKAIRDQRRALSRVSVSEAFQNAVATEEFFPLYHSAAFARSDSSSSASSSRSRSRSNRRLGSASSGTYSPRSGSDQEMDQSGSLPLSELAQTPVREEELESDELARRGS